MKFDLKKMYSFLLSHTFPGLLLMVEISLFLRSIGSDVFHLLIKINNPVIVVLAGYAFSTLLGTILDGMQHFIFDTIDWIANKNINHKINTKKKFEAFKKSGDKCVKIYDRFLSDDLWYPYEALANISIAMLLGLLLLWGKLGLPLWFWSLCLIISIILFWTAKRTYYFFWDEEEQFIEVYSREDNTIPQKDGNV